MKNPTPPPSGINLPVAHSGDNSNQTTPEIQEMLYKYKPDYIAANDWLAIRDFVLACTLLCVPTSWRYARSFLGYVARFSLWCTKELGLPLDADEIFHPAHIARFSRTHYTGSTPSVVESRLGRIADLITGERTPRRVKQGKPSVHPYTSAEMREFISWATTQKNERARTDAGALLATCAGAGLRSVEAMHARVEDVRLDEDGVTTIHVAARTHPAVPVRAQLAHFLHTALEGRARDDYLLFAGRTSKSSRAFQMSHFPKNSVRAPVPTRLRDSWLIALLHRMPLPDVARAADLNDLASLRAYTPYLVARDEDTIRTALHAYPNESTD